MVEVIEAVVRSGGNARRLSASGQDIYAIRAPMVVEAAIRVVSGQVHGAGVFSAGEAFGARDFLESLCPEHLALEMP
ncbi:hypothetical protein [Paraburkholderia sp. GAS348]|uniref:hypothetical protein n=1 Tax=Paraburkholderia sp. GAS348 TaxID=3035132 RepID=UPI003D24ACCC